MLSMSVFDRHATTYDQVAESVLGTELRNRVRHVAGPLVNCTTTAADLGCGSGIDAAWLGERVRSVRAVDASTVMVEQTKQRCSSLPNVTVVAADIAGLQLDEPVEFVLANFGVVNCVGDLRRFGERLAAMLTPGGHAVIVTMARWCPIELAIGLTTLNRGLVMRRARGAAYGNLSLRYVSARRLAAELGPRFEVQHAEALGLVLPPFEQRGWIEQRPRLHSTLAWADRRVSRVGAAVGFGDHHIVVLRKHR